MLLICRGDTSCCCFLLRTLCLGQSVWPWKDWERMNPSLPPLKSRFKTRFPMGKGDGRAQSRSLLAAGSALRNPQQWFCSCDPPPSVKVKNLGVKTEYLSQEKPTQQVFCPSVHRSHPQSLGTSVNRVIAPLKVPLRLPSAATSSEGMRVRRKQGRQ